VTSEPKVQICVPVSELLEPFLDRYRYVYGSGDYNLLSQLVSKTTDKILLLHVVEKALSRLADMYEVDADRYAELSIRETFNPTGSMESIVRGYGTRAENSRNKYKASKVLSKLTAMVQDSKKAVKVATIIPGKL
jgi:hypothetical protein